jgi:hypothetical protein
MSRRADLHTWLKDKEHRYMLEKWFWILFVPVAFITGLVNSVAVVSLLSIYALVITAGGAQQAAKASNEAMKAQEQNGTESGSDSS